MSSLFPEQIDHNADWIDKHKEKRDTLNEKNNPCNRF